MTKHLWLIIFAGILVGNVLACGSDDTSVSGGTLVVTPGTALLTVVDGQEETQVYVATLVDDAGNELDVTADASFTVDRSTVGSFSGATFTARGLGAGNVIVTGTYEDISGTAALEVNVQTNTVLGNAPSDSPDLFTNATESAGLAPTIIYPDTGVVVPPNIGVYEVHWSGMGGTDLYEIQLQGPHADVRLYIEGIPGENWHALALEHWNTVSGGSLGQEFTVTMRGMVSSDTSLKGSSAAITNEVTSTNLDGGIYYWSTVTADQSAPASALAAQGLYRHDWTQPGQDPEAYYIRTDTEFNGTEDDACIGCHAVSKDGTKIAMAIWDDQLAGTGDRSIIIDVATKDIVAQATNLAGPPNPAKWHIATFNPAADRMLAVQGGSIRLQDGNTGAEISTIHAGSVANGYANHPDFHPQGNRIVYVYHEGPSTNDLGHVDSARIMVADYSRSADTVSNTEEFYVAPANYVVAYPSFSPDGEWIIFTRSLLDSTDPDDTGGDSNDNHNSETWVMKADGTAGAIALTNANGSGQLTNSWAKWAPFEQSVGQGTDAKRVLWLTFSSKRNFGVRLDNESILTHTEKFAQLWMTPFFPEDADLGNDPSAPSFWLPFQDLATSNHIAQWTTKVVSID